MVVPTAGPGLSVVPKVTASSDCSTVVPVRLPLITALTFWVTTAWPTVPVTAGGPVHVEGGVLGADTLTSCEPLSGSLTTVATKFSALVSSVTWGKDSVI